MSGFSVAWLDLREGADNAARNTTLAAQALAWLTSDDAGMPIIVDLGSGTGSTLRALTRHGADNFVWRLVDHNPALLNEALRRHGKTHIIEDYEADLLDLTTLPLTGTRLVTASALFDLVSLSVVDALAVRLVQHQAGLYAALNYDGITQWNPPHPLDGPVLAAFNQDQRRDKGLGLALGPDAADYLQMALGRAGYTLWIADSPWELGPDDAALVCELIPGIASAVADGYGLDRQALQEWKDFRLAHAATGHCVVGHQDVLALPPALHAT
ncbi:MAG: class I SAM-dependent methyltransferase [Gammaproteobacteria bacterium]|nr:class I SAM-dependent methyltransferase [Gammaproteobacteria bacterium]